jgi:adenosylcobinamide amidohydrolase
MKKFPNLTELNMTIDETFNHDEEDEEDVRNMEEELTLSTNVAVHFLHYVSKIKLSEIDCFLTRKKLQRSWSNSVHLTLTTSP